MVIRGYSIAVDSSGYAYVTGYTTSTNFPTTSGAYQTSNASIYARAFVTKLATDGKSLVYSTYLGGSGGDLGNSIALDTSGYAYVTGETSSTNFPTTSGAYQTSYQGSNGSNAFVTKLKTDGSGLVYSTFLGGTGGYWGDWGNSIAIDSAGYAYVTGEAVSANFPTTSGAYQTSNPGGMWTTFVTKLKPDGSGLVYSTFLGGGTADTGWSVAVDSNGYACVVGSAGSTNFPTTSGAYQTAHAGGTYDVFFTKLASNGQSLYYSTFLGGNGFDNGLSVAMDSSGNAYVTGRTASTNFPTTSGAYQTSNKGGSGGSTVFVFKLSGLPTVVFLASFSAQAEGGGVLVEWVTKTEIDNVGFNLYRSTGTGGTYLKLNPEIIPGLLSSVNGRAYTFYDENVTPGNVYCYQLEDIDLQGERTMHGPVCVDWSAAGSGGVVASGAATSGGESQGTPGSGSSGSSGKTGNGSSNSNASNSNASVGGVNVTSNVTQVGMRDLRATWTKEGVLVEWSTGFEVNNLGFHVYREGGTQLLQLTPDLVAGSALRSRSGTLTPGYSYSWLDNSALSDLQSAVSTPTPALPPRGGGNSKLTLSFGGGGIGWRGVKYWVEDVDLSGKRTWHGPVSPVFSDQPLSRKSQSALLSQLARMQAQENPDSARVQALQTRLGKNHGSALKTQNSSFSPQSSTDRNIEVHGVDDGTGSFIGGLIPSIISDRPPRNPSDLQWGLAASPAVKIYIQKEGWYRITQPELIAAGLSPTLNPRYLRLFVDGQEQAMGVSAKGDQLGPQDVVEFYGTGVDTPFTDTRVYWLISGSTPGQRIQQVGSSTGAGGQVTSTSFPFTVVDKPRTLYFAALLNGDASNFFGPLVATAPTQQVLSVQHLDPAAPGGATLEVTLQGVTAGPHQVQISLNGVVVGALNFSDQTEGSATVSLSPGVLQEGDNVVQLAAQGGDTDLSLIDTLQLTYWHTYTADNDTLRLPAVGGGPLGIDGFSSSQIRVMDITDPQAVQEVLGTVQSQGAGYSIQLEVPGSGSRTLWAFAESQVEEPGAIVANQPSNWHQAGRAADLVVISHADFLESLTPLKALREGQGLSVALIDVEDLYDEFSFGMKTPQALKDFLSRTQSFWAKAPGFVLLVGDASFDPRNYLGLGNYDFVPTKLIDTAYLETASDDWFVDFNGDGLPQMAVGRFPPRTAQEATTLVSKIVGYEQGGGRSQTVLLVADINDGFDFEAAATALENLLPVQLTVQEIFRSRFADDDQVQAALLQDINQGPLLVNYVGHGSVEVWRGSYFDSDYAEALTNGAGLPFFLDMTCLNGYFQDVYTESLAEALLKAEQGGALAVWASSGLTEPENQSPMNQELIRLLFTSESLTLGQATAQAKKAANDQDVRRTWIFFGDPSTRLKY